MRPLNLFRIAVICSLTALSNNVIAQMTNCNVFLAGRYVELGISPSGSYGSSVAAPAGYHANTTGGSTYTPCGTASGNTLGFIADPDMDGWAVGSPAFYGDYFIPGAPFEGWAIQIGTNPRADAWNTISTGGYTNGLTGTNTAYTASGSKVIGTWLGSLDSLTIKQETTLDTNDLYFSIKVTLTNTSHTAMNDIYSLRSLDPDNDEVQSFNFSTINKIEYQLPNVLNATAVSATGTSYPTAYMSLGTTDTNARCFIYSTWSPYPTASTSIASMFNGTASASLGTTFYAAGATATGDIAIALALRVAHIASVDSASDSIADRSTTIIAGRHPANTASFTYFYAFSKAAMDTAISRLTVVPGTLGVKNVNTTATVNVYPNPAKDLVNITGLSKGSTLFLYDIMGRLVQQRWNVYTTGTNTFSTGNIASGNYILLVKDPSGAVAARLPWRKL